MAHKYLHTTLRTKEEIDAFNPVDTVMPISAYSIHDIYVTKFNHIRYELGEETKDGRKVYELVTPAIIVRSKDKSIPHNELYKRFVKAIRATDVFDLKDEARYMAGFVDCGRYIGGEGAMSWTCPANMNEEYVQYTLGNAVYRMLCELIEEYHGDEYEEIEDEDDDEDDSARATGKPAPWELEDEDEE